MLYFFIRMWSWQDKALVQTPICIVYMWQNSEYQSLLCCFYILWFLTPFLCHPQHWTPRSFQRASLIHWISSLLMYNRTKSKSHPLQYKATRKPFWCYLTPPPTFPHTRMVFYLITLLVLLGLSLSTIFLWSLKEQTLYGTCFCMFGIYLKKFELLLIKDVQNILEIFGVWNQYIARNPVQINKWNGNKPYLGTQETTHRTSFLHNFSLHSFWGLQWPMERALPPSTAEVVSTVCPVLTFGQLREEHRLGISVPEQNSLHGF